MTAHKVIVVSCSESTRVVGVDWFIIITTIMITFIMRSLSGECLLKGALQYENRTSKTRHLKIAL